MKKLNKILSIILAILMVIFIIPITASAETPTSGTCGENITWEFDGATGILTISGTGNMYDYLKNNLVEITRALLACENDDIEEIMGFPDNFKLCSCMTLFELVAPEIEVFSMVLENFYNGERDQSTLELACK